VHKLKPIMGSRLFLIVVVSLIHTAINGQSLISKVDSLKFRHRFYLFSDFNTIQLTKFGPIERQFPKLLFSRIEYENATGFTSIEGFVDVCCFDVLVAKVLYNDSLSILQKFGKTEELKDGPEGGRFSGRFRVKVKLSRNDVIIVGNAGSGYWGATIVPIGKIF